MVPVTRMRRSLGSLVLVLTLLAASLAALGSARSADAAGYVDLRPSTYPTQVQQGAWSGYWFLVVYYDVVNVGTEPAGPFVVTFSGSASAHQQKVSGLAPGQSARVGFAIPWVQGCKEVRYTLRVDAANTVVELDETDNTARFTRIC